MQEIFRFKQFTINQQNCAMKVGTDSILFGSLVEPNFAETILDIGTGTGLLALMMAQKAPNAYITAIEIDELAAKQAQNNFANSKFSSQLTCVNTNINLFEPNEKFDLIITNPPYFRFKNSYKIDEEKRSLARHDKDLTFEDLLTNVVRLLNKDGEFGLILPTKEAEEFKSLAQKKLSLIKQINIIQKADKQPNRIIMCFGFGSTKTAEKNIIIYNNDNTLSEEFKEVTQAFYL